MRIFRGKQEFTVFAEELVGTKVLVVYDINTGVFSTDIIEILLGNHKEVEIYCFEDKHLLPEINNLKELLEKAKNYDYILGIGSGTLNDICKYTSFICKVPYGIYATAPSMDGYVSSVSALYENGKKVTLPTTIPCDILIDIEVLKNAPLDMIVAGAGDMIGKYTSLLDWKFSSLLNGEKYDSQIVERMKKAVALCMSKARELVYRNESAVNALIEGLILSGIEMQNAGNSRPASGCEHHISHYLEMIAECKNTHFAPHGVQVALGTLVGNELYRYALSKKIGRISLITDDILELPTIEKLKTLYKEIGLPISFEEIGVDKELLEETIVNAYTVRERFTIMSFLNNNGVLQTVAEEIAKGL